MFGLKTEWFYHQPGPWMKSFPLKLNKQLWALLTPCSQLLEPTGSYLGPAFHPGPAQAPSSLQRALSPGGPHGWEAGLSLHLLPVGGGGSGLRPLPTLSPVLVRNAVLLATADRRSEAPRRLF